ncbi:MAG: short-chain dehydrogenase [Alicyclobacillus sp. RIFOXYA1_FULL_53_8]|nr:MAG: short-chain dehydrogenase [Alicyclobacillus sp. RIFOXYA1_FULL_53_8]
MKNFVIYGGSKGLGDAFAKGLPENGDNVWIVSRSRPESLNIQDGVRRMWIESDLSEPTAAETVANAVKDVVIDVLIYNAGIWESRGFTQNYDFENDDVQEIMKIIAVNLTSAITSIQKLLPNLKRAENAKIILIGSTAGLDNTGNSQVSYVASKFGIRGVGSSIREHVRKYGIGVTIINPGEIAETPFEQGIEKAISAFHGKRIPVQDIVHIAKCVVSLSKVACVKEINVPSMEDMNA